MRLGCRPCAVRISCVHAVPRPVRRSAGLTLDRSHSLTRNPTSHHLSPGAEPVTPAASLGVHGDGGNRGVHQEAHEVCELGHVRQVASAAPPGRLEALVRALWRPVTDGRPRHTDERDIAKAVACHLPGNDHLHVPLRCDREACSPRPQWCPATRCAVLLALCVCAAAAQEVPVRTRVK